MSFIEELKAQNADKNIVDNAALKKLKETACQAFAEFNLKCIKDEILEKAKSNVGNKVSGYRELHIGRIPFESGFIERLEYNYCGFTFVFNGPISGCKELEAAGYVYTYFSPINVSHISRSVNFNPKETVVKSTGLKSIFASKQYKYSLEKNAKLIINKIVELGKKDGILITPLFANQYEDKLGFNETVFVEFDTPVTRPAKSYSSYISLKYEITY